MTEERWKAISEKIGYLGEQEKAYQLYKKLGECDCENTERVEFALRHWGWTGKERMETNDTVRTQDWRCVGEDWREASEAIRKMKEKQFVFPKNGEEFIKQFYKIKIPIRYGGLGASLDFSPYEWCEDFYESEIMSIQYNVRMIMIGVLLYLYNDFECQAESLEYYWGTKAPIGYWDLMLFLGRDDKVYYYYRDAGISGIFAENLVDFFVDMFEFPGAKKKAWTFISEEESLIRSELCDEIERQAEVGTYQPREI